MKHDDSHSKGSVEGEFNYCQRRRNYDIGESSGEGNSRPNQPLSRHQIDTKVGSVMMESAYRVSWSLNVFIIPMALGRIPPFPYPEPEGLTLESERSNRCWFGLGVTKMGINLDYRVVISRGENEAEYELRDYPVGLVSQLYDQMGDEELIAGYFDDVGYTPDHCPNREVDLQGNILINGHYVGCYHLGYVTEEIQDWGDHFEGCDSGDHEGEKVATQLNWCRANCKGAWFVTGEEMGERWGTLARVLVSFADPTDAAKFMVEFGMEDGE